MDTRTQANSHARCTHQAPPFRSRREFIERLGCGFGAFALNAVLAESLGAAPAADPLTPKVAHMPHKAKSVIYLFMHGGASHIDTFDPKPELLKLNGKTVPPSFAGLQLQFTKTDEAPLLASTFPFKRYGQSGIEVSSLFPNVAAHADDLAVVRSCHHEAFIHSTALHLVNTGSLRIGFPSLGSWILYGLGSESRNLPSYVVMDSGPIKAGTGVYGSGFLPAVYQGTTLRSKGSPLLNLKPPEAIDQGRVLDALSWFNENHRETRRDNSELSARIAAYELAFRMQTEAPGVTDLSRESPAAREMYGLNDDNTRAFGAKCLLARRLVEQGVRFIQIYSGTNDGFDDWDGHSNNDRTHTRMAGRVDKPIAALLADLKQRGMLDETLVVWGGDFGRTPVTNGSLATRAVYETGRDHNPYGYTMWFAGGGVKGGQVIGATDELGFKAIQDPVHVHDINATILALLGLDHRKLTYHFQGRDFRVTDVHGDHEFSKKLTG